MSVPDSLAEQASRGEETSSTIARTRPGVILFFLCVAGFMVFLDVSIVNVALPAIERSLAVANSNLQYVVTTYGTMLGGFLLLGGRLADAFGRRRVLQSGLTVFALSSLLAGVAHGDLLLIFARGLQGLGAALILPAALSLLTNTYPEGPERHQALGIWGGLGGIASVVGVVAGGLITDGPGWRWIFFINVPIGLIAALLAPVVVNESRRGAREAFDLAGAIVLTAALVLLIFTLGQTIDVGWGSGRTVGSLIAVVLLLAVFGVIEQRAVSPLIPFRIFRSPSLRAANIATVLLFGTLVSLFFFASLFMQQVLGYSPIKAGMAYVPLALIVTVGAGVTSGLAAKISLKPVLLVGLLFTIAGLMLLARTPVHAEYAKDVLPAFLIVGLGLGLAVVAVQVVALGGVSQNESGLAAGLINTSQEAGGALGVAVISTIAFSRVSTLTQQAHGDPARLLAAQASVFHHAFFASACFSAASFLLVLVLLPSRAEASPPRPDQF